MGADAIGFLDLVMMVVLIGVVGAIAGVIAGLLGVGGGIVLVPALYYVFQSLGYAEAHPMHVAVATSLATIIFTSLRSVQSHNRKGAVDWDVLKSWAPMMGLGALLGAFSADYLETLALLGVFGAAAFLVALHMAFGRETWVLGPDMPRGPKAALWSFPTGVLSALMGIGGGTFGVPLMTLFSQTIHRAVATAAGFGVVIAVPSVIAYALTGLDEPNKPPFTLGYINLVAFALIVPMTVLCAPIGVKLAHRTNTKMLRLAFAIFLAATGLNMLRKALYG